MINEKAIRFCRLGRL